MNQKSRTQNPEPKTQNQKKFVAPRATRIEIDTSVSLLMTSTPPGNPGMPVQRPTKRIRHKPFHHDGYKSPFDTE